MGTDVGRPSLSRRCSPGLRRRGGLPPRQARTALGLAGRPPWGASPTTPAPLPWDWGAASRRLGGTRLAGPLCAHGPHSAPVRASRRESNSNSPRSVVSDHLQVVDYLGEALLFFDLLVDEPLQEDVGRVVAFLQGQLVQAVYTGGDLLRVSNASRITVATGSNSTGGCLMAWSTTRPPLSVMKSNSFRAWGRSVAPRGLCRTSRQSRRATRRRPCR